MHRCGRLLQDSSGGGLDKGFFYVAYLQPEKEGEASRLYSLPELAEKLRQFCPGQTTEIKLRALAQSLVAAGIQRIHTSVGNRYWVVEINA